jgi:hypothetical protein
MTETETSENEIVELQPDETKAVVGGARETHHGEPGRPERAAGPAGATVNIAAGASPAGQTELHSAAYAGKKA